MSGAALAISIDRFVELTRLALAAEDLKRTVRARVLLADYRVL